MTNKQPAEKAEKLDPTTILESKDNMLFFMGDIEPNNVAMFMERFHRLDETNGDITLVICSNGGEIDLGIAMHDTIKSSRNRVITLGMGTVGSAAVLPFIAGDIRLVQQNCELFFHQPYLYTPETGLNKSKLNTMATGINSKADKYCQLVAENSRLSVEDSVELCEVDTFLNWKDAASKGLIDGLYAYAAKKNASTSAQGRHYSNMVKQRGSNGGKSKSKSKKSK